MKDKTPRISVVVPTYNSWETLISCVESFEKQSVKPFEIIVVDNASKDRTWSELKKLKVKNSFYTSKLKIIRNNKNLGVTGGRNAGIKHTHRKSDYIFFFDHDMVAHKMMLEKLYCVAEESGDIGIVTPKIYYWSNQKRIWSAGTGVNLWTGQVLFRGGSDVGQYDEVEEVQVAPAAMLVEKKVINKIGGFDDRYFSVWEDTDFSFRARKIGFKVMYAPDAVAYHDLSINPNDEADRLLRRAYFVGRNRIFFMKDYGKSFPLFLLFLPVYLFYYLRLAIGRRNVGGWFKFIKGTIDGIF